MTNRLGCGAGGGGGGHSSVAVFQFCRVLVKC